jgi:hypothetical protein
LIRPVLHLGNHIHQSHLNQIPDDQELKSSRFHFHHFNPLYFLQQSKL